MITRPGVYGDMSEAEYHSDPAPAPSLSSSLARVLLGQTPLHAWHAHPRLNPARRYRHSEAFDVGKACHALLLGRGSRVVVVDADDWRGREAREARDAARETGETPMLRHQYEAAEAMADVARARLKAFGVRIEPGRTELAAFADLGVWRRALIDFAPEDPRQPLYDYKTCEDASPEACIRAVCAYGYDVQAAHYLTTWEAATGERRGFRFIFQEKEPPHELSIIELHAAAEDDADWMQDARHKVEEAARIWGECLKTNHWPGYPAAVAVVGAPAWHRAKWADRAVEAPPPSTDAIARARAWQSPEGMK